MPEATKPRAVTAPVARMPPVTSNVPACQAASISLPFQALSTASAPGPKALVVLAVMTLPVTLVILQASSTRIAPPPITSEPLMSQVE